MDTKEEERNNCNAENENQKRNPLNICNKPFKEKIVVYINSIEANEVESMTTLSPSETLSKFESFVVNCAKEVAETEIKTHPDWFTQSKKSMFYHNKIWNCDYKQHLISNTEENHSKLKSTHSTLQCIKRQAKRKWQSFLADCCQRKEFKDDPKAIWNIVFKIIEGFNAHHKKYSPKTFSNSKGDITKNSHCSTKEKGITMTWIIGEGYA